MVEIPQWDETFSVGNNEIDKEHQQLFGLLRALTEYRERDNRDFIGNVLITLVEYSKKHFYHEEVMLKQLNYPELEQHKKQHATFIRKVTEFQELYEKGDAELNDQMIEFIKMWLTTHIFIHDKAYARFIKKAHRYTT